MGKIWTQLKNSAALFWNLECLWVYKINHLSKVIMRCLLSKLNVCHGIFSLYDLPQWNFSGAYCRSWNHEYYVDQKTPHRILTNFCKAPSIDPLLFKICIVLQIVCWKCPQSPKFSFSSQQKHSKIKFRIIFVIKFKVVNMVEVNKTWIQSVLQGVFGRCTYLGTWLNPAARTAFHPEPRRHAFLLFPI